MAATKEPETEWNPIRSGLESVGVRRLLICYEIASGFQHLCSHEKPLAFWHFSRLIIPGRPSYPFHQDVLLCHGRSDVFLLLSFIPHDDLPPLVLPATLYSSIQPSRVVNQMGRLYRPRSLNSMAVDWFSQSNKMDLISFSGWNHPTSQQNQINGVNWINENQIDKKNKKKEKFSQKIIPKVRPRCCSVAGQLY